MILRNKYIFKIFFQQINYVGLNYCLFIYRLISFQLVYLSPLTYFSPCV